MRPAFLVAAALCAFAQGAQSAAVDVAPSESCLSSARDVAMQLQPAADLVAGRHVEIDVIGGTVAAATAAVAEGQAVLSEVNLSGSVVILGAWCDLELLEKKIALAHELGHVIDRSSNPVRFYLQLPLSGFLSWNERPTEQRANDYARRIMQQSNETAAN